MLSSPLGNPPKQLEGLFEICMYKEIFISIRLRFSGSGSRKTNYRKQNCYVLSPNIISEKGKAQVRGTEGPWELLISNEEKGNPVLQNSQCILKMNTRKKRIYWTNDTARMDYNF